MTLWALPLWISCHEVGSVAKWLFTAWPPASRAATAEGCFIDTVMSSSLSNWSWPHFFAAAICSTRAWMDTFTEGVAILWSSASR